MLGVVRMIIRFVFKNESLLTSESLLTLGLTCARRATGNRACASACRGYPTLSLPSVMIDVDALIPSIPSSTRDTLAWTGTFLTHGIWSSESLGLLAGAVKHHSRPQRVAPSPTRTGGVLHCMRFYHTCCNLFGIFPLKVLHLLYEVGPFLPCA